MGGFGSGQRPWRLSVKDSRALDLGELCDGGRWHSAPRGELRWSAPSGKIQARLRYAIKGHAEGQLLLGYRYWPRGEGACFADEVELVAHPGQRTLACCPGCGSRVRTLFAPPGANLFRCRGCFGLIYRRSQTAAEPGYFAEVARATFNELQELPRRTRHAQRRLYLASPPAALAHCLEAELPLASQELRLWALRLRGVGLSYRQIAALTESSKSSIARICAAGHSGLDAMALLRERLERASSFPAPPEDDDARALAAYRAELTRHCTRLALMRLSLSESEERVLIVGAELEAGREGAAASGPRCEP